MLILLLYKQTLKPMTEGVELRVAFEENGDQTNLTFSVVHATEDYCRQQEQKGFYTAGDRL